MILLRRIISTALCPNQQCGLLAPLTPDLPFDRAKLIAYMHLAEALPGPGEALVIKQAVKDAVQQLHEALDSNLDDDGDWQLGVLRDNLPALIGELSLITDRDDPQFVDAGPELGGPVADAAVFQTEVVALHIRIAELAQAINSIEALLEQHGDKLDRILDNLDTPQVGVSLFGLLSVSGKSTLLQALRLRAQTSGAKVLQQGVAHSRSGLERALGHLRKPFEANRAELGEVAGLLEGGDRAIDAGEDIAQQAEALEEKAFLGKTAGSQVTDPWPDLKVFRDVEEPWCPEMVVIPAGEFLMGSPKDEPGRRTSEGPQVRVRLAKFALGVYAVTFEEYDAFCRETDRKLPRDEDWGRGRQPAINVSWRDAEAYCEWLSGKTEGEYRLPSEAEWEYACRAGTEKPFWWGDTISPNQANYRGSIAYNGGEKGKYRQRTLPVDAFAANPWELHQVHGNVWEWCADDWAVSHEGAAADGRPRVFASNRGGRRKVARGGSWFNFPRNCRSASRGYYDPDFQINVIGFRVARTLTS
jgi:formylglycine-generating enzyme required for sulfatase activity